MFQKLQVERHKFQVGMGGKTWKCVLIRVETGTKPIKIRHLLKWKKLKRKVPMQNGPLQLKMENSTLVILVTIFSISS